MRMMKTTTNDDGRVSIKTLTDEEVLTLTEREAETLTQAILDELDTDSPDMPESEDELLEYETEELNTAIKAFLNENGRATVRDILEDLFELEDIKSGAAEYNRIYNLLTRKSDYDSSKDGTKRHFSLAE